MERLYAELREGQPPAEALRLAKPALRERGSDAHAWAAFVAVGAGCEGRGTRSPLLRTIYGSLTSGSVMRVGHVTHPPATPADSPFAHDASF